MPCVLSGTFFSHSEPLFSSSCKAVWALVHDHQTAAAAAATFEARLRSPDPQRSCTASTPTSTFCQKFPHDFGSSSCGALPPLFFLYSFCHAAAPPPPSPPPSHP
jgi:hypothetical protein